MKSWRNVGDRNIDTRRLPHPVEFGVQDWAPGKLACKTALQQELGLPPRPDLPLVGFIGRLADQKGVDLIVQIVAEWSERHPVQWVLLGHGDPMWEQALPE